MLPWVCISHSISFKVISKPFLKEPITIVFYALESCKLCFFLYHYIHIYTYRIMAQQPSMGHGLLIIEDSRWHSATTQTVGLLWTSDQPNAETSTLQNTTHKRPTTMIPAGFEPTIPASERPQTHALERAATGIGAYIRRRVKWKP